MLDEMPDPTYQSTKQRGETMIGKVRRTMANWVIPEVMWRQQIWISTQYIKTLLKDVGRSD